jgi:hypothetical protein
VDDLTPEDRLTYDNLVKRITTPPPPSLGEQMAIDAAKPTSYDALSAIIGHVAAEAEPEAERREKLAPKLWAGDKRKGHR